MKWGNLTVEFGEGRGETRDTDMNVRYEVGQTIATLHARASVA